MHIETARLCAILNLKQQDFHTLKRLTRPDLPSARAQRFRKGATPKGWCVTSVIKWLRRVLDGGLSANQQRAILDAAKVIYQ